MAFIDTLFKASFRGIPFFVKTGDTDVGRRFVENEYPGRDTAYIEDVGRRKRNFTLDGYFLGDDANAQLNKLFDACEKPGNGTLVHPTLGTKQVIGTCKSSLVMKTQRQANFTLSFVEIESNLYPDSIKDFKADIDDTATTYYEGQYKDSFTQSFDTQGINFLVDSSVNDSNSMFDMLTNIVSVIPPQFQESGVTSFLKTISDAKNLVESLIATPSAFADLIIDTIAEISGLIPISDAPADKVSVSEAALGLIRFGESTDPAINPDPSPFGGTLVDIPGVSTNRTQERKNRNALVNLVRLVANTESMKAAIDIDIFDSFSQINALKNDISEEADKILTILGDDDINQDEVYDALDNIRSIVVSGLVEKGATTKRIIDFEVPPAVLSTLFLAYDKYEDIEREQEIIDRNIQIRNPTFLPSGTTIEVLNA